MTTQWKLSTALVVVALALGCHGGANGPEDKAVWDACISKDGVAQLDGQRYECDSGLKGKSADEKETFEFHGGRFHSVGCDEYRFETGVYTATRSAETIGFTSTTKSPTEGTIVWTGYVRGTEIEGTFVWTKTGQAPVDYWFKGKRAK